LHALLKRSTNQDDARSDRILRAHFSHRINRPL
jgi:hypothetical protein